MADYKGKEKEKSHKGAEEMKNSGVFGYTLLIFGLGVIAGLLIAPRKGEDTRKIVIEHMEKCCGKTCDIIKEKTAEIKKQEAKYEKSLRKDLEEA